jgi:hypothetical protein
MTNADLIRLIADVGYSPEHDTLNRDSTRNWLLRIAAELEKNNPPPPRHSDK